MKRIMSYEDITITNDLLFKMVMQNKQICKGVISRLLKMEVEDIEYPVLQKEIQSTYSTKGVRLDVYVRTKDGSKLIDVEVQNKDMADLELRTRFYQSMIDADNLFKGQNYSELKESYIIFICSFDHFGLGLPRYSFSAVCDQCKDLIFDDKTHKIFYNTTAYQKESDSELKDLLKYFSINKADSDFCNEIDEVVKRIKEADQLKGGYLLMNLHDQDIIIETKKEDHTEALINIMEAFNVSLEKALETLKLPKDKWDMYRKLVNQQQKQ